MWFHFHFLFTCKSSFHWLALFNFLRFEIPTFLQYFTFQVIQKTAHRFYDDTNFGYSSDSPFQLFQKESESSDNSFHFHSKRSVEWRKRFCNCCSHSKIRQIHTKYIKNIARSRHFCRAAEGLLTFITIFLKSFKNVLNFYRVSQQSIPFEQTKEQNDKTQLHLDLQLECPSLVS